MEPLVDDPAFTETLESLIEGLQPKLKRVLARFRIPPEDAEDILQQSFVDYVFKRASIYNPEAWLVATVRNRSILYWRGRRHSVLEAVDEDVLEGVAAPVELEQSQAVLRHDLQRALHRLPPRYQSLLKLRYGLGYKPSEVAARLGYEPSSIRKVTSRCLDRLNRQLRALGFSAE